MEELTDKHKKVWVKGLMIDCPMGIPLVDCPAKEVRDLPIPDRLKLVDEMDIDQLTGIITHHKQCLKKREGPRNDLG